MRRLASLLLLPVGMALASLTACEPSVPEGRFACEVDEDCPDDLVCRTRIRRCFSTQADAGPTRDGGASDAGASDAGASDAGASDAGASDAGASDAGASDAGDASVGDAGA